MTGCVCCRDRKREHLHVRAYDGDRSSIILPSNWAPSIHVATHQVVYFFALSWHTDLGVCVMVPDSRCVGSTSLDSVKELSFITTLLYVGSMPLDTATKPFTTSFMVPE